MKKRSRFVIILAVLALCFWFLWPSISWYARTPKDQQSLALGSLEKIKDYTMLKAEEDVKTLVALAENKDAPLPLEFSYLEKVAKKNYKELSAMYKKLGQSIEIPSEMNVNAVLASFRGKLDPRGELQSVIEGRYRDPILEKDDVFIVVSQSGETADTLAALRLAKSRGSKVIAITNCVGSTVSRESDYVIYTLAGPEIAVASTKAYTTQLMCLYMLSILLGKVRGVISSPDFANLLSELEAIPENAQKILDNQTEIQKFASCQFNKEKIFYIGRQFDSANSLESALKLKEVSYMHCEAFSAGELKHGPIALVDKNTLVIAIATEPSLYEKLISNIIEVKSRGAATMVITNDSTGSFDDCCDSVIQIPSGNSEFSNALESMLSVIPAQLFAYYCSVLRGNDPDKPRNLAKSVTVE